MSTWASAKYYGLARTRNLHPPTRNVYRDSDQEWGHINSVDYSGEFRTDVYAKPQRQPWRNDTWLSTRVNLGGSHGWRRYTSAASPETCALTEQLSLSNRRSRMANITATLPIQLLDKMDDLIDKDKVPSRSFVIREAVRRYLKELEK